MLALTWPGWHVRANTLEHMGTYGTYIGLIYGRVVISIWYHDKKNMSWSFPTREPVNFLWRYARQVIHIYIYMSRVTTMDPNWNHLTSHQLEESVGRSTQEPPIFHGTNRWMDGFQSPEAIATLTDSQSITVGFVPMFSWVIRFAYVWITLFVCEFPMKLVKNTTMF